MDQGALCVDNGITRSNTAQGTRVPMSACFCSLVLTCENGDLTVGGTLLLEALRNVQTIHC